jgi:hypothetical protein
MKFKQTLLFYLRSKVLFYLLSLVNLLVILLVFSISSKIPFPDEKGYWFMGESILHGQFSSWYFSPSPYSETLRTPIYPIFVAISKLIYNSMFSVKLLQLAIYLFTVYFCLDILKKLNVDLIYRNLFLFILIPNIQIPYYTGNMIAEILAVFSMIWLVRYLFCKKTYLNGFGMGISSYILFGCRPAFLILPFILFLYFVLFERKKIPVSFAFVFIITFSVLLIPFGLWNKQSHGIFKLTPIEGGAGVAHMGYWQLKLPDNYIETFYWGNVVVPDKLSPILYSPAEKEINAKKFEEEWLNILQKISIDLSTSDSINLKFMQENNPGIFVLYNSEYTLKREKALWKATISNIKVDPSYYIKSRFFHFFRFYVTGINTINLDKARLPLDKIKVIYPFIVTLVFIFLGLLWVTALGFIQRCRFSNYIPLLIIIWYTGLIHIPFVIQSRYTIPCHLVVLLMSTVCTIKSFKKNSYV